MRCLLLFLGTCMMLPQVFAQSQGENRIWTFGHHNGLNFNAPLPVFFQNSLESLEGCASMSDEAGNLLFYSNGNTVWNAAGVPMPNGSGIEGNGPSGMGDPGSSSQGVAIVHAPGYPNRYYLFTLDAAEQINAVYQGYLRYSVIDMNLNGGTGDVVAGQKNITLDTAMSEKMTVVRGAGCYYWLIVHHHNSATYRAFKISATGIGAAVSSTGSWTGDYGAGQIKVSFDGTKIATCTSMTGSGVEISSFDNATGMISNTILIDALPLMRTGTCFSPDNTKLYISASGNIAQYDLSSFPNTGTIIASKTVIATGLQFSHLRNGPDGKIYVAIYANHSFIGAINAPNNTGMACNPDMSALAQPAWAAFPGAGTPHGHGLGNDVLAMLHPDTTVQDSHDTLICSASGMLSAPGGCDEYLWQDGVTGQTRTLNTGGTYWVYGFQDCHVKIDTFHVRFMTLDLDLGPDTAICRDDSLLLDAAVAGALYSWQDGSSASSYNAPAGGVYTVKVRKDGCTVSDTIAIGMIQAFAEISETDTLVCSDETMVLHVSASPVSSYQWNTGSTGPAVTVSASGSYIVTATNICGIFTDSIRITIDRCDCPSFIPNAFSPNGDQLNDAFIMFPNCSYSNFSMSIYNRFGQRIFYSTRPDKGWDGQYQGGIADAGTYFYYIRFEGPRGDSFEKKGDLVLIR